MPIGDGVIVVLIESSMSVGMDEFGEVWCDEYWQGILTRDDEPAFLVGKIGRHCSMRCDLCGRAPNLHGFSIFVIMECDDRLRAHGAPAAGSEFLDPAIGEFDIDESCRCYCIYKWL